MSDREVAPTGVRVRVFAELVEVEYSTVQSNLERQLFHDDDLSKQLGRMAAIRPFETLK